MNKEEEEDDEGRYKKGSGNYRDKAGIDHKLWQTFRSPRISSTPVFFLHLFSPYLITPITISFLWKILSD
jgi:hypothetical protein